ncbi:DUF3253 domain-containing protein [Microvirga subterranea]|uniref:Uncharacterized protein DUF3253 n=1 Tax=Microvirga subterranea TaxID=186651 RepID=A0A370HRB1_9HYPH|nr:DUF3253 domain-containing protein [Microvirga subterranea]RDI61086.1 uncharacterized protein DUF3253 [Microvirga subterranea]
MPRKPTPEEIETAMLALVTERGAGKNLDPTEVARVVGGDKPDEWGPLMGLVRQVAVRLMKQGRIVILRKGRPADPDDFRGIYRLTLPPSPEA